MPILNGNYPNPHPHMNSSRLFYIGFYSTTIIFGYCFGRLMTRWPDPREESVFKHIWPHAAMVEGIWKREEDEYDNIYPT